MSTSLDSGRTNQKLRTRFTLLQAVRDLLDDGRNPTFEEVAEAAMVSRATAYRYFPSIEAMIAESTIHQAVPDPDVAIGERHELLDRVLAAVDASTTVMLENEVAAHAMAKSMADRWLDSPDGAGATRPARRLTLIDAALKPHADRLGPHVTDQLRSALALVGGMEAVISARDIVGLEVEEARATFAWAATALVAAAEQQAVTMPRRRRSRDTR